MLTLGDGNSCIMNMLFSGLLKGCLCKRVSVLEGYRMRRLLATASTMYIFRAHYFDIPICSLHISCNPHLHDQKAGFGPDPSQRVTHERGHLY